MQAIQIYLCRTVFHLVPTREMIGGGSIDADVPLSLHAATSDEALGLACRTALARCPGVPLEASSAEVNRPSSAQVAAGFKSWRRFFAETSTCWLELAAHNYAITRMLRVEKGAYFTFDEAGPVVLHESVHDRILGKAVRGAFPTST